MGSPFLALDGAVLVPEAVDDGVPSHYGFPTVEQRRLERGTAIVDLSSRSVLTVSGPDRLSWIHSLASQDVAHLAPGESSEALFLDPNGRLEHAVKLLDDGERLWMLAEPATSGSLLSWLDRMRFMLRVEVADVTDAHAVVGLVGDGIELPVSAPSGVPLRWDDPWRDVVSGGWQYASETDHPGTSYAWSEVVVPREELPGLAARAASGRLEVAGSLAAEALRVAAWRPRQATEADERTIPHELDWLRTAVHLHKGCYRGQETVAKVHNLGHPPRRLVMLHLDGSESVLPAHGSPVFAPKPVPDSDRVEQREVGHVTTAVLHHELGPVALAVVKRSVPVDLELTVRAGEQTTLAASQEVIVPSDAGATAHVPRLPRLGVRKRPGA